MLNAAQVQYFKLDAVSKRIGTTIGEYVIAYITVFGLVLDCLEGCLLAWDRRDRIGRQKVDTTVDTSEHRMDLGMILLLFVVVVVVVLGTGVDGSAKWWVGWVGCEDWCGGRADL